jgi:hypothetical protein
MTRAQNMLEWLKFTMNFILPIQDLQKNTATLLTQVKSTVEASKANTTQSGQANAADLKSKFEQLLSTFRECLKEKQNIQVDRERFNVILRSNTNKLLDDLIAEHVDLKGFIPQKFLNKEEVDSLNKQIKEREVLLSTDLEAGWQEIAITMPDIAWFLDYIEDALNNNGAFRYEAIFKFRGRTPYQEELKKPIEQIPLYSSLVSRTDSELGNSLVVLEKKGPLTEVEIADIPVKTFVLDGSL